MGIPHLFYFVEKKVPQCLYDIDIIKEIENWSRKNSGQPTIVFDFYAFTHAIKVDPVDQFFGRRILAKFKLVEQFFTTLRENGVKLVFFENGSKQLVSSERVTIHCQNWLDKVFRVLDTLYKNNSVKELLSDYVITNFQRLHAEIRMLARKFGNFQKSYHNDCEKEAATYAIKNNAMAVLSNGTDYLIFKGTWKYWSIKHLNLQTMTTKCYDKTKIRQYLKLTEDEMPLLATLAGNRNYLIPQDILNSFHRYLGSTWYKFENISQFIINNFRKQEGYDPEFIAIRIFGRINELPEYTEIVRKSLNYYNIDLYLEENDIILENNEFMRRMRTVENHCFSWLLNLTGFFGVSYFDLRTPQFEKFTSIILKLKRREVGVVLLQQKDETTSRKTYCFDEGQYVCKTFEPEYPPFDVPNLEDLYDTEKNVGLNEIKLKLIAWVLSDRLDFNAIQNIENKYLCACLVLYYMVENSFITVREADIFLHTIETVYKNFSSVIDIPYFDRIDPRVFQLVFLYSDIYLKIKEACEICGLFGMEADHMDGLYFHHAYAKMHNLDTNQPLNDHLAQLRLYEGL